MPKSYCNVGASGLKKSEWVTISYKAILDIK